VEAPVDLTKRLFQLAGPVALLEGAAASLSRFRAGARVASALAPAGCKPAAEAVVA
jgi:hypothetical protein